MLQNCLLVKTQNSINSRIITIISSTVLRRQKASTRLPFCHNKHSPTSPNATKVRIMRGNGTTKKVSEVKATRYIVASISTKTYKFYQLKVITL